MQAKSGRCEAKSEGRQQRQFHYLTVEKLSTLLRGIISKHHGKFYYLNRFHSFATKNQLELQFER